MCIVRKKIRLPKPRVGCSARDNVFKTHSSLDPYANNSRIVVLLNILFIVAVRVSTFDNKN